MGSLVADPAGKASSVSPPNIMLIVTDSLLR